jgi:chlorobactene glucosyltransferase
MADYFTHDLVFHLIIFQAVILVIALSNIWITRRARHHAPPHEFPMVSILVPARNEEKNIVECVQSLLAQDYPRFEVLVLDDQSTDGTREILKRIAASHPGLQGLDGTPPPGNVVGKNWACSQLASRASGEFLLFTDADTRHSPDMLRAVVTASIGEQADLLTGFPRQVVHSWGERLLVPFFSWVLSSFIPLGLGYRLQLPALSSAVGQLMLFRGDAYQSIGGHAGVSASVVDDMSLARRIKSVRLRWRVAHIADLVSCRMYPSTRETIDGFTKNLFAVFDYRLLPFLFAFLWLLVMFWEPLVVAIMMMAGQASLARPAALAACLGLSVLLWMIHDVNTGIPWGLAFLYPFTILANVGVAFRSCAYSLGGHLEWKGRKLARIRWKWL